MDFAERIAALAQRVPKVISNLKTEESTKTALVMPFISALGYDVFDPSEVIPEFVADVGLKKGEKVDYAIARGDEIMMLFECKKVETDLSNTEYSQLYRYFGVTKARIAILTNGVQYRFFTDLDEPNKMDPKPFLEIDLTDIRENLVAELRRLTKQSFDLDSLLSAAADLKYTSEIKRILAAQLENPDEEFVRFFFTKANPGGRFKASAKEQFKDLVARAFGQFISDRLSERLRTALEREDVASGRKLERTGDEPAGDAAVAAGDTSDAIVTTEEEIEGLHIVKAIVCDTLPLARVTGRDSKSYYAILVDDNNRRQLCRLWFNRKQKYVSLFDAEKNEDKQPIESVADLYKFADRLKDSARRFVQQETN